jgi:hypothetical protein
MAFVFRRKSFLTPFFSITDFLSVFEVLSKPRCQRARSLALRAATSIAHLWKDQGKREQAREVPMSIYDWFTEGFDTLDLKEAKTLSMAN